MIQPMRPSAQAPKQGRVAEPGKCCTSSDLKIIIVFIKSAFYLIFKEKELKIWNTLAPLCGWGRRVKKI
jgi:hypothetical protein